jgi:KAP family P-loop domain
MTFQAVSTNVGLSPQATGDEDSTAGFKLVLDEASRQPALGFPSTARALAEIVMESDPQFAIGIFGGWGSGKTTLMRAIEDHLDSDRAISVQFSAWRYEKEEALIVPVLDVIREALVKWADAHRSESEAAKKTAATIGKATRSILAGLSVRVGLPNALELSFDANKALQARREWQREELEAHVPRSFYHASFRALSGAFETFTGPETDRRIVVFVDDLDRCFPESALQVLESMKLFFDLEGFVFVVGLDQDVVQQVIDLKYGRDRSSEGGAEGAKVTRVSGEEYIKKVFQLPYRLAPVAVDQLDEFLSAACEEAGLPPAQRADLHERVRPHLRYIVGDAGVNPREVKRYINAYTLQRKISEQLDPDVVLVLQTIAFRPDWRDVHNAILAYGPVFIEALGKALHGFGQPTAVKGLDPELTLPDSLLEYLARDRPGEVILSRSEQGTLVHADDIDRYIYRGEAVRSPQDPFLLRAIRGSAEARRLLMEAEARPGDRVRLIKEASRAFEKGRLGSYLEFGSGSVVVRELLLHEWNAYIKAEARLRDPDKEADLQAHDLEELSLLAGSISDRLLGVYRAGAAPAQRVQGA